MDDLDLIELDIKQAELTQNYLLNFTEPVQAMKQLGDAVTDVHENTDGWYDPEKTPEWEIELLVADYEVHTLRLPRKRKGKTPIDVGIVTQDGLKRVRLSMGEDGKTGRKNSDLDEQEVEDLIAMLNYNLMVARGEIIEEDEKKEEDNGY